MKILYIAPNETNKSGIAKYSDAFVKAMQTFAKKNELYLFSKVAATVIPRSDLANFKKLHHNIKILRESRIVENYDCVHVELGSDLYLEFFYAYWLTRGISKPLILTIHDAPYTVKNLFPYIDLGVHNTYLFRIARKVWNISFGYLFYEKRLLKRACQIVALSNRGCESISKRFGNITSTTYVPHIAFNDNNLRRLDYYDGKRKLNIIFLGHLHPVKGVHVLIDAIIILQNDSKYRNAFQLNICGESKDNYVKHLKEKVINNSLQELVVFSGFISDDNINTYMLVSDVIILPYLDDRVISASGPLISAMDWGTVPIASNVKAFAEEIENGINGFVCPPGKPQAIAERLKVLIDSPETLKKMSINCQKHISKDHSWLAVASKMEYIYNEVFQSEKN